MMIPIVNSKDKIIGYKDRKKIVDTDIYRVSALWLTNERGEFLLAKRALTKKHDPGKWGLAVAGTVEKGETYAFNIRKEIFEELGIQISPKKSVKIERINKWHFFVQWYVAKINSKTKFSPNIEEVAELKWFSKKEFYKQYKSNPEIFLSNIKSNVDQFE